MSSYLRPDERASQHEIEKANKRDQALGKGAKSALSIATTVAGFGAASKILPFLSEHIPVDMAIKGISKLSPKIGNFLKRGMSSGLDVKEGLDYLRDKLNPKKEEPEIEPEEVKKQEAVKKFNEHVKKKSLVDEEQERFDRSYGKQSQQIGPGQKALLEEIKKLQQLRGQ